MLNHKRGRSYRNRLNRIDRELSQLAERGRRLNRERREAMDRLRAADAGEPAKTLEAVADRMRDRRLALPPLFPDRLHRRQVLLWVEYHAINDHWQFYGLDIARAFEPATPDELLGDSAWSAVRENEAAREKLMALVARRWPYRGGVVGSIPDVIDPGKLESVGAALGPMASLLDEDGWARVLARALTETFELYDELDDVVDESSASDRIRELFGSGCAEHVLDAWRAGRAAIGRRRRNMERQVEAARRRPSFSAAPDPIDADPDAEPRWRESFAAVAREHGSSIPATTLLHWTKTHRPDGPRPEVGPTSTTILAAWARHVDALPELGKRILSSLAYRGDEDVLMWLTQGRTYEVMHAVATADPDTARLVLDQVCRVCGRTRVGRVPWFLGQKVANRRRWIAGLQCAWIARAAVEGVVPPASILEEEDGYDEEVDMFVSSFTLVGRTIRVSRDVIVESFRRAEAACGTFWRLTGDDHHPRACIPWFIASIAGEGAAHHARIIGTGEPLPRDTYFFDGRPPREHFRGTFFPLPVLRRAAALLGVEAIDWERVRVKRTPAGAAT